MGELHVNMNITLDGVIQANGGPTEQDAGFEYAGWERPYGDEESGQQIVADVEGVRRATAGAHDVRHLPGLLAGQDRRHRASLNRVPKYVASRGTPELSWDNSTQSADTTRTFGNCASGTSRSTRGAVRTCCRPFPRSPGRPGEPVGVSGRDRAGRRKFFPEGTGASRFEAWSSRRSRIPQGRRCCATGASMAPRRRCRKPDDDVRIHVGGPRDPGR